MDSGPSDAESLVAAAFNGDENEVKRIISHNPHSVNGRNARGQSALYVASRYGSHL